MSATIFQVDDDHFTRAFVGRILHASGYEVITAQSGEEALAQVDGIQPNLIILDVLMPGID
ncbi:response regulator, partial [Oscillochloris sp. ZM17-4]|uniref:response regulator transcription factor n=1 Tax=Oscillochloris sp. ZM17-4 TaxID=2866714 RepID=UPI001C734108